MTCSYCGDKGHNKKGCQLREAGLMPKKQPETNAEDEEIRQSDQGEAMPSNMHEEDMYDYARAQVLTLLQICLISLPCNKFVSFH